MPNQHSKLDQLGAVVVLTKAQVLKGVAAKPNDVEIECGTSALAEAASGTSDTGEVDVVSGPAQATKAKASTANPKVGAGDFINPPGV